MSIGNQYSQFAAKVANYTIKVSDDVIVFTTAAPGVVATLPLAAQCLWPATGQNTKQIANAAGSSDALTIAVQSGNTLLGATASAAQTLAAGESAIANCSPNLPTVWTITGGDATQGVSGYSGYSAYSGYSGTSGASGYSGISGKSGFSGYSGVSGFSGYSGISGFSGYSGISGYSGYSGASGKSGYSGY